MKSKMKKIMGICMVLSIVCSGNIFAATMPRKTMEAVGVKSSLLAPSQRSDTYYSPELEKGMGLGLCLLSISNDGGGVIGVVATTSLNRAVDWGRIIIYLERWNVEKQDWDFLKEYDYEFPNGSGTSGALEVMLDIKDQEPNYYYRLRGSHEVEFKNSNGDTVWEGTTTRTDGVFITKH